MEVYEPQEDSYLMQKYIKNYSGKKALDMGTGSGIQAIELLKTFDSVIGVDINPEAIAQCKKLKSKVNFSVSNLFSNVKGKFDLITFNPPYLPQDKVSKKNIDDLALYGGEKGWETIANFLKEAPKYLTKNGKVLLIFTSLTNPKKVLDLAEENNFMYHKLDQTHVFFEDIFLYELTLPSFSGITNLHLLSKGKRGVIYTGHWKGKKVSVKVKNPDSKAINAMQNEANFLEIVNKENIGPTFLFSKDNYLVYEYVDGTTFKEYMKKATKKQIQKVINEIEKQAKKLDEMNINKFEMSRPYTNVLVTKKGVVLIDFERARKTTRPKNYRQFLEFKKKIV